MRRKGGANHGAKGRLEWAYFLAHPAVADPDEQAGAARQAGRAATAALERQQGRLPRRIGRPRGHHATAFFEAVRTVEVLAWLVEHPDERSQLDWLLTQVGQACEGLLAQHPQGYKRLADHFWCDVLASLATAVDRVPEDVASLADKTWQQVRSSRDSSRGNRPTTRATSQSFRTTSRLDRDRDKGLTEAVLEPVVRELVTTIVGAPNAGMDPRPERILIRLRVLAVLLCPDPYAHALAWDVGVVPLATGHVVIRGDHFQARFLSLFQTPWQWPK